VVVGRRSTLLTERVLMRAREIDNRNVRLEELDAGHCVRRDAPEDFHALVDPWLAAQL
jgi:lipase